MNFLFLPLVSLLAQPQQTLASRAEVDAFMRRLPDKQRGAAWYGNIIEGGEPAAERCGFGVRRLDGVMQPTGVALYKGDVNNDGELDYTLAIRCGGSLAVDSVEDVFVIRKGVLVSLGFWRVMEKNGMDGSYLPLQFGQPFVINLAGKTVMRFVDEDWLWEQQKITRISSERTVVDTPLTRPTKGPLKNN